MNIFDILFMRKTKKPKPDAGIFEIIMAKAIELKNKVLYPGNKVFPSNEIYPTNKGGIEE